MKRGFPTFLVFVLLQSVIITLSPGPVWGQESNFPPTATGGIAGTAPVTSTTPATASNPTINTDTQLTELTIGAAYLNTAGQPYLIQGSGTYNTTSAAVP